VIGLSISTAGGTACAPVVAALGYASADDTWVRLLFYNQTGHLHLLKGGSQLLIGLRLVPARHMNDPLVHSYVEPEPFGVPPLSALPSALGEGLLASGSPAFGRLWADRHIRATDR
jgi:hypothetical protein